VKNKIIYEQPLNSKIRSWLRLEHLFHYLADRSKGLSHWDSRSAIDGLIELLVLLSRLDVKQDLIDSMQERQKTLLEWQDKTGIDKQRLFHFLRKLDTLSNALTNESCQVKDFLAKKPLLSQIYRYHHLPAGRCGFDIPVYHRWLQQKPQQRRQDLASWLADFGILADSVDLILYLIRQNALISRLDRKASDGLFQEQFIQTQNTGKSPIQLVRIFMSAEQNCYPEISGGKHRISVRFFEWSSHLTQRQQMQSQVDFQLAYCQ